MKKNTKFPTDLPGCYQLSNGCSDEALAPQGFTRRGTGQYQLSTLEGELEKGKQKVYRFF